MILSILSLRKRLLSRAEIHQSQLSEPLYNFFLSELLFWKNFSLGFMIVCYFQVTTVLLGGLRALPPIIIYYSSLIIAYDHRILQIPPVYVWSRDHQNTEAFEAVDSISRDFQGEIARFHHLSHSSRGRDKEQHQSRNFLLIRTSAVEKHTPSESSE